MTIQEVLLKYWGFSKFRPLQEEIIQSVLDQKDTLALLPTGGGKSLCYQVPALFLEGICLVISPLIALMEDQVNQLKEKGIKAVFLNASLSKREIDILLDNCIYGNYKFLYLSPERLSSELVRERIKKMNVNLIAVDEAHCISQWGYDFRPAYLKIKTIREIHPEVPLIALTATATKEVAKDIQEQLSFNKSNLIKADFERKNLAYIVLNEESKNQRLLKILNKVKGSSIVYVRSRKKAKDISIFLNQNGISADYYHAGLEYKERSIRQTNWINGNKRVMVATNAFGMGINKPDVRSVVHIDLPDSLEAYFQEAGRAGRDEQNAYAILLYNAADTIDLENRQTHKFPEKEQIKRTYKAAANYLQVPVGGGKDISYSFDLADFANRYNFQLLEVFNAIGILENGTYVEFSEKDFTPSRLHFKVNKDELYKFQVEHKSYDSFIKLLLRTYGGIFENYVPINESKLATLAKSTIDKITIGLEQLMKLNIVDYHPKTNLAKWHFINGRIDDRDLSIPKAVYEDRKEIYSKNIKSVIHYCTNRIKCRSQILLNYFGDTNTYRCGVCDICLEMNKLEMSDNSFTAIKNRIEPILENQPSSLDTIFKELRDIEPDKILKVVNWLIDNGRIIHEGELLRLNS